MVGEGRVRGKLGHPYLILLFGVPRRLGADPDLEHGLAVLFAIWFCVVGQPPLQRHFLNFDGCRRPLTTILGPESTSNFVGFELNPL